MPKIKIATAQSTVFDAVRKNGVEIRNLIKQGKHQGASLIHFCEGALSGYAFKKLTDIDFEEIRLEIKLIQDLCLELNVWTVIGSAHELSNGNRPHNSLYIISNNGEIVNRYDKRKCSHSELQNWFTPGFDPCTFEIAGLKFACSICIEIQFPEIFIEAEQLGVDCMLFSAYSKEPMFGIQAQGYAATNNYWISMSIPANESILQPSQFIGPDGEVVGRCMNERSSLVVNEIDTEDKKWEIPLKFARPWRSKARNGKIYEDRRVIDQRSERKTIL